MHHAISPVGADLARHERSLSRDESFRRAVEKRIDQVTEEIEWQELEEAMTEAPLAQRKEFWSALIDLLEVEPRFMHRRNVSLIAAPLQEAVAVAVDTQVRKEFEQ